MDLPPSLHPPPHCLSGEPWRWGVHSPPPPAPACVSCPHGHWPHGKAPHRLLRIPPSTWGAGFWRCHLAGETAEARGGDVSLRGDSSFPGRRVWVQSPCRPCCGLSEPCLSLSRAGHGVRCGTRCLEAKGGTTGHHTGREGDGERRGRVLLTDRAPPVMLCFVLTAGGSPLLLDRGPSAFDVLSCVAGNGRCFLQPTQARGLVLVWRPSIR